jgi:sporulation integral membrane protein YlbJ
VLPTLFPFFIATELLCKTNFVQILGKIFNKFMKPIFNVPGESTIALIMGIISGYPVGAKVVCNLYENKICSKAEAERLIAFTNNSGPIFILGTVGVSLLGNVHLGKILLISHILSSLLVGFIFRFWKKDQVDLTFRNYKSESKELIRVSNLGEILGDAIKKSISTILLIGGFVVLFSVTISILSSLEILTFLANLLTKLGIPYDISLSILTGIIELTNGIQTASLCYSTMPLPCILTCSFLLGFGGISVLLQVFSIISKSKISIKPYFYGKILHGIISVILTWILVSI